MRRFMLFCLAMAVLVAGSLIVQAEVGEKAEVNVKQGEVGEQSPGMSSMALAHNLAAYGRAQKSPEALAVAAQILLDNPTGEFEGEQVKASSGESTPKSGGSAPAQDAAQLLNEAKRLAAGNETAMALVTQVQGRVGERKKGAVGGPKRRCTTVYARDTDVFRVTFRGREMAEVAVVGDGTTDLDLYVYDDNGFFIASDTDGTDRCYVSWTPRRQGWFRIEVRNYGRVYNAYCIYTN